MPTATATETLSGRAGRTKVLQAVFNLQTAQSLNFRKMRALNFLF